MGTAHGGFPAVADRPPLWRAPLVAERRQLARHRPPAVVDGARMTRARHPTTATCAGRRRCPLRLTRGASSTSQIKASRSARAARRRSHRSLVDRVAPHCRGAQRDGAHADLRPAGAPATRCPPPPERLLLAASAALRQCKRVCASLRLAAARRGTETRRRRVRRRWRTLAAARRGRRALRGLVLEHTDWECPRRHPQTFRRRRGCRTRRPARFARGAELQH